MHCLYFKATVDRVQRRIGGVGGVACRWEERGTVRAPTEGDSNYKLSIKIHKTQSRSINYCFTIARCGLLMREPAAGGNRREVN